MMDKQAGDILVKYAAEIAKRCLPAKMGDTPLTPLQKRDRSEAWRLMSCLIRVMENIKESDFYWSRGEFHDSEGDDKEAQRLFSIAAQEDRAFVSKFGELERLLAEIVKEERADPQGKKYAKKLADSAAARAESREAARLEKNAKVRERNAAKKAVAAKASPKAKAPAKTAKTAVKASTKAVVKVKAVKPAAKAAAKPAAKPAAKAVKTKK